MRPPSLFRSTRYANLLIASILLLGGCGGGKKDPSQSGGEKPQADSMAADTGQGEKRSQPRSAVLPTTLQVASSFRKAGLPYKDGLVLSPDLVDDLVDPSRKKMAFGAYSADLAYLVLNKKGGEGKRVMNALLKLSDDLNLSRIFDTEKIAKSFQKNTDKKDSLVKLIIRVQERFDTYVAKNRSRELRTISYAGGWIEAMYLAAKSGVSENKEQLNLEVEEQMTVLDKLLTALDRDLKNPKGPLSKLVKELKEMHRIYKKKAPEPGKKLPKSLLKELQDHAIKTRKIISKASS